MRTVLICLLMAGLALAGSVTTTTAGNTGTHVLTPGYMTDGELSLDNGNIQNAWCYYTGANSYAGDQYDRGSWTTLTGIKYYVWVGWPDGAFQGFAVACWAMESGMPGAVIWPTDGNPIYNPNTGGNWITQTVEGGFDLVSSAPNGFLVGIGQLYNNPACDGFGVDDTGAGAYDWTYYSGAWGVSPYGKGSARALVSDTPVNPGVETTTMGTIRALYR